MKLTNPTDDESNAAFAEKVAGWTPTEQQIEAWIAWARISGADDSREAAIKNAEKCDRPHYTTSADAVLPWLERDAFDVRISFSNTCDTWYVELLGRFTSNRSFKAEAETFPRAAVIALLRAHGVEVEFSK